MQNDKTKEGIEWAENGRAAKERDVDQTRSINVTSLAEDKKLFRGYAEKTVQKDVYLMDDGGNGICSQEEDMAILSSQQRKLQGI